MPGHFLHTISKRKHCCNTRKDYLMVQLLCPWKILSGKKFSLKKSKWICTKGHCALALPNNTISERRSRVFLHPCFSSESVMIRPGLSISITKIGKKEKGKKMQKRVFNKWFIIICINLGFRGTQKMISWILYTNSIEQ